MIGAFKIGVSAYRGGGGGTPPNPDFVTVWDTTQAGSASDTIVLPMSAGLTVDWGDGNTDTTNTHTYASGGTYTVTIIGSVTGFRFNNSGDRRKLIEVVNCGGLVLDNSGVFYGCNNLATWSATDAPSITTTSFYRMFRSCSSLSTPDFSNWSVSLITNCHETFKSCSNFNGNISTWELPLMTTANSFLSQCLVFNQDIGGLNPSSCTIMFKMMENTDAFDQDISSWDINQVSSFTSFMLSATGLSTVNYDALLIAWDAQGAMSYSGNVNFGGSQYTSGGAAEAARTSLITKWGAITDGGAA